MRSPCWIGRSFNVLCLSKWCLFGLCSNNFGLGLISSSLKFSFFSFLSSFISSFFGIFGISSCFALLFSSITWGCWDGTSLFLCIKWWVVSLDNEISSSLWDWLTCFHWRSVYCFTHVFISDFWSSNWVNLLQLIMVKSVWKNWMWQESWIRMSLNILLLGKWCSLLFFLFLSISLSFFSSSSFWSLNLSWVNSNWWSIFNWKCIWGSWSSLALWVAKHWEIFNKRSTLVWVGISTLHGWSMYCFTHVFISPFWSSDWINLLHLIVMKSIWKNWMWQESWIWMSFIMILSLCKRCRLDGGFWGSFLSGCGSLCLCFTLSNTLLEISLSLSGGCFSVLLGSGSGTLCFGGNSSLFSIGNIVCRWTILWGMWVWSLVLWISPHFSCNVVSISLPWCIIYIAFLLC